MKKILVVVDMQNDFVNGALGTKEAEAIIDNAVRKIESFDGYIYATLDTHFDDYPETSEGKMLPVPHCIKGTGGWDIDSRIKTALEKKSYTTVEKRTFGSVDLPVIIGKEQDVHNISIELIGLCTDICVVSNALILKAAFPEIPISVDASCCAGVTPQKHIAALETMKSCQINVM